uniref:Uncharacterized protein n=1 Tax=Romanomermis culicivorax TaxID=13658 RepID=A0A915HTB6_ROMCU
MPKDTTGKLKFERSVGCRKIIQNVDGNVSVVRECAYSGGKMHGMKRMGNRGVRIFYYQCETDRCNAAKTSAPTGLASIAVLFLSLLLPVLMVL